MQVEASAPVGARVLAKTQAHPLQVSSHPIESWFACFSWHYMSPIHLPLMTA